MGRHKKNKIQIPTTHTITRRTDDPNFDLTNLSRRAKNAIAEIHRHNYNTSAGFIDLKFYLCRELHYMRIHLKMMAEAEREHDLHKYDIAYDCLIQEQRIMEQIILHLPDNVFIPAPPVDPNCGAHSNQEIVMDWFDYIDKCLTPLNESDILQDPNKVPDLINRQFKRPTGYYFRKSKPYWLHDFQKSFLRKLYKEPYNMVKDQL